MSRRRVPRRFRLTLWAACLVLAGPALAGLAAPAAAEPSLRSRTDSGMRTVVGGSGDSRGCQQAARANRSDEAGLAACSRALADPALAHWERAALLFSRGAIRLRRQEAQAGLSDFDAVLALDPRMGEAYLNRAAALAMMGDYGAAVAAITTGLSYGVREPHKAYFNRGAAREALGDLRGALEDYSSALDIRPDWGPAETEIARFARARRERLAQMLGAEANGQSPAVR